MKLMHFHRHTGQSVSLHCLLRQVRTMREDIYVAADFGLAKIAMKQSLLKTVCGTPGYCGMCHGLETGKESPVHAVSYIKTDYG